MRIITSGKYRARIGLLESGRIEWYLQYASCQKRAQRDTLGASQADLVEEAMIGKETIRGEGGCKIKVQFQDFKRPPALANQRLRTQGRLKGKAARLFVCATRLQSHWALAAKLVRFLRRGSAEVQRSRKVTERLSCNADACTQLMRPR